MKSTFLRLLIGMAPVLAAPALLHAAKPVHEGDKPAKTAPAPADVNAGLKLPAGFSATAIFEGLPQPRHIAVNKNGDVYVKLGKLKEGKGIVQLHQGADGKATIAKAFGDFRGTGMYLKNGFLYASSDEEVFRFKLDGSENVANETPEKLVTGLLSRNEHEAKAILVDNSNRLFVNVGAYSNSCQSEDRKKGSPGMQGCPILDSAGGIWEFKADQANQQYGDGSRYATGLRNVVGMDFNYTNNELFVMQHGRDQLHDLFPDMYTVQQSAELPAECMYMVKKGDDCGWPYIYYDQFQHKKILAPEYGGDSKKTAGEKANDPVVAFPGHLAPNGLLFYTGDQFPAKYRNGAFIAFHGSWNRAPQPQEGYYVVFVPFKDGKPSGKWEVFANGFAGVEKITSPGQAKHRPCGLAQGPDGALYVSDDAKGTIYKITYKGK